MKKDKFKELYSKARLIRRLQARHGHFEPMGMIPAFIAKICDPEPFKVPLGRLYRAYRYHSDRMQCLRTRWFYGVFKEHLKSFAHFERGTRRDIDHILVSGYGL